MEQELNCAKYSLVEEIFTDQLSNCYFHPNWDTSIDQNDPFESALSSIVSSPIASSNCGGGDGMIIRELIGRLGSICDDHSGGEVITLSPNATGNNSANTSCYSTPLNSPPSRFNLSSLMLMGSNNNNGNSNCANYPFQQNLGSFNCDPGFAQRAAKISCLGGCNARNLGEFGGANSNNNDVVRSVAKLENGRLSRVNSEKKLGENGESREGSSVSEQNPGVEIGVKPLNDANSRKRKSVSKAKLKDSSTPTKHQKVDVENEESNAKRSKVEEEAKKENTEQNAGECNNNKEKHNNNNSNNKDASKPDPPKDYIHVRARRGQATDSHSLAERVRREKISERMKFLQDLVPGCSKVTGKATVLDEIINYVQSLQRQVEFLSMKLSTVTPRMEFNMEDLLSKDMLQSQTMYPIDQNSVQAFPFAYQSTQQMSLPLPNGVPNEIENHSSANPAIPLSSIGGFKDSMTQLQTLWEDDLQSIVQMGIVQNQTQNLPAAGTIPNAQMKVEL